MDQKNMEVNYEARTIVQIPAILHTCLTALDKFLQYVKKTIPNDFQTIIDNIFVDYNSDVTLNFQKQIKLLPVKDYKLLSHYPNLILRSKLAFVDFLNYEKYVPSGYKEEIEVDAIDLIRLYNFFEYYFAISILKVMPKEEALKYYQDFNREIVKDRHNPHNYVKTIEEMLTSFVENNKNLQSQEAIIKKVNDSKWVMKTKVCRWGEMFRDLDTEFSHAMVCSADFDQVRNHNPNFLLTRTKTIMQGYDYCDFCYHDKRSGDKIEHPPEEFWEDL